MSSPSTKQAKCINNAGCEDFWSSATAGISLAQWYVSRATCPIEGCRRPVREVVSELEGRARQ
eukprot:1332590-Alexandrium_andersonii.AAC.1